MAGIDKTSGHSPTMPKEMRAVDLEELNIRFARGVWNEKGKERKEKEKGSNDLTSFVSGE
jgi:hypothetical protein